MSEENIVPLDKGENLLVRALDAQTRELMTLRLELASIIALLNPSKTTDKEAGIAALIDKIDNLLARPKNLSLELAGIIVHKESKIAVRHDKVNNALATIDKLMTLNSEWAGIVEGEQRWADLDCCNNDGGEEELVLATGE